MRSVDVSGSRFLTRLIAVAVFASASTARAATYSVLHSFGGADDGEYPGTARLLHEGSRLLFGTTPGGGTSNQGVVFRLSKSNGVWTEDVPYSFTGGSDGANPVAGLTKDSTGSLFGTTSQGGSAGFGTVFRLAKSHGAWALHTIYSFTGGDDGGYPNSSMIIDGATGALYGTTQTDGAHDCGTVFELSPSGGGWKESTVHGFGNRNRADGCTPDSSVAEASNGALYGVTEAGGPATGGAVYELFRGKAGWVEKTLYGFGYGGGGYAPGDMVLAQSGRFIYGTTYEGGKYNEGTVFALSHSHRGWSETDLYDFNYNAQNNDGANPVGISFDRLRTLYVTTFVGGMRGQLGTIAELTQSQGIWTESILHLFGGDGEGNNPYSRLIEDRRSGALFGTTAGGGTSGRGTVYEVTP